MNPFGDVQTNVNLEQEEDRLGGFAPLDTDIYPATIKVAFAGQSTGGAKNFTVIADLNGREYRETIYWSNKKGEHFYVDKDNPEKKKGLPGYNMLNAIAMMTTEKPLFEQKIEEKVVKVYDPEAKQELPKNVPVMVDMIGKPVFLGIQKSLENKQAKNGAGDYVPIAETRETNSIAAVFHSETKQTLNEAVDGREAAFYDAWLERNKGKTRDARKLKDGGAQGNAGRPGGAPPAAGDTPRTSLFGNKG